MAFLIIGIAIGIVVDLANRNKSYPQEEIKDSQRVFHPAEYGMRE